MTIWGYTTTSLRGSSGYFFLIDDSLHVNLVVIVMEHGTAPPAIHYLGSWHRRVRFAYAVFSSPTLYTTFASAAPRTISSVMMIWEMPPLEGISYMWLSMIFSRTARRSARARLLLHGYVRDLGDALSENTRSTSSNEKIFLKLLYERVLGS